MEKNYLKIALTAAVVLVVAVGVTWLIYNKKGGRAREVEVPAKSLGGQISDAVKNPATKVPETNPFKANVNPFQADTNPASSVNPFSNPYKNPFE